MQLMIKADDAFVLKWIKVAVMMVGHGLKMKTLIIIKRQAIQSRKNELFHENSRRVRAFVGRPPKLKPAL